MTVTACICVSIWASLYHISPLGLTYIEYCKSMIFHVFTFTFPLCPSVCVGRAGVVVTFPKTGLHVCCFLLILQSAIMVFVFVFVIKFVFVFVFVFEAPSFPHNLRAAWARWGGEDTEQGGVRRQGGGVEVPVERWWYLGGDEWWWDGDSSTEMENIIFSLVECTSDCELTVEDFLGSLLSLDGRPSTTWKRSSAFEPLTILDCLFAQVLKNKKEN